VIQKERVSKLNDGEIRVGNYVLYWMQSSVRAHYNHALEHVIDLANSQDKPLIACFGLTEAYPQANLRHYRFLLEGLKEAQNALAERGVVLTIRIGSPPEIVSTLAKDAAVAVVDAGYTRTLKRWRAEAAVMMRCPLIQVEDNVTVPVGTASPKEEYSAYTLRRKITPMLPRYMAPLEERELLNPAEPRLDSLDLSDLNEILIMLDIDASMDPAEDFTGGTSHASANLERFISDKLDEYPENRNDPTLDATSDLSPYLHFGQISPLYVALRVRDTESPGKEAFLEELIVRRELAANFVHYNSNYDSIDCLPDWCTKTLMEHEGDPREHLYSLGEFEAAETHDSYWNAAQRQMVKTGKMHGYMRMYWGKKILEWSPSPREAYDIALYLNDRYELDGRDPNGYAGIAWCFGKHDRPWKERPVFGKVRYMNDRGLRRKFDADLYVRKFGGK
jgi:deoxyribodipyrimidine photo-lyase